MKHLDVQQETIKNTQLEITKTSQLLSSDNNTNSNSNSNSNSNNTNNTNNTKPLPSNHRYITTNDLPTSSLDKDFSTFSTQKR